LLLRHIYLDNISKEEKYLNKIQVLGTCDPYTAPAVFQSNQKCHPLQKRSLEIMFKYVFKYA